MLIRAVGFVDIFSVVARLHRLKASMDGPMILRDADGAESEVFAGWNSLKRMMKAAALDGNFAGVRIEQIGPNSVGDWAREPAVPYRAIIPLVTNPLCIHYVRHQSAHMPVGNVLVIKSDEVNCVTNWGGFPCFHLVADLIPQVVTNGA